VRLTLAVLILPVLLLCGICVDGQSPNGSIRGIVFDPDTKTIPGAEIIVVNDATGVQYVTSTNGDGFYVVENLPPGPYRIQVSKFGFKGIIKPDIILNVQDGLSLNFTLPVGASSVVVTVEGGAPMINTTDASVSTIVDRDFVENMPLNGRSFQDLILLTPGVITTSPQLPAATGVSGEFSVNGQRTESNYFTVDGVSANGGLDARNPTFLGNSGTLPAATALGTTQGLVSVDALQEFRVETSSYSAEYGRTPGAQFSLVSRSGTNQWHGSAFDYVRNGAFDANDLFNDYYHEPQSEEQQNDFGGTLGGPVDIPGVYDGKGRTFFFFSYEGLRLIQPVAAETSYVPDVALRTNTTGALQQVLNAFPRPNGPDLGDGLAQFVGTWSNPSSLDATSIRLDQEIAGKSRLFFRFSYTPSTSKQRDSPPSQVDTTAFTTQTRTLGVTTAVSKRWSNDFRLNYSSNAAVSSAHIDNFAGAQAIDLAKMQGINTQSNSDYQITFFFFFGTQPELQQYFQRSRQRQWNFVDAVSLTLGRHQIKFGADYRRLLPILRQENPYTGYYYFSEASVMANNADGAFAQGAGSAYPLYQNFSVFGQDEWHLTPRLTLSLGLRWEVNPAPGVTQGLKPYTVEGDSLSSLTLAPQGTALWQTGWHNFAPRLGAAYVLHNTSGYETVIRGGGGIFYDTGQQAGSQGFGGPGYTGFYVPTGPLSFPVAGLAEAPPVVNPPAPPYYGAVAFPTHLQLPYTLQTNLSFEQALGKAQALTVSYVGAFGRKLLQLEELNPQALNPMFANIEYFQSKSTSDYNSLQVQFRRRLTRNLEVLSSYTWSHCLDYGSQNNAYPYIRGNCDYDLRQNLSSAFSYSLPMGRSGHSFAHAVLQHWAIDDRFSARTGFPVTLQGNGSYNPVMGVFEYTGLDLVPGQPIYVYGGECTAIYGVGCPGGRAVNINAFSLPPAGEYGNAPRNFVRGFGAWQMDAAVRREFPIHESLKLQFRVEAFNVFNHPNFGAISSYYFPGSQTFGLATTTLAASLGGLSPLYQSGGPRSMQFALKLTF